MASTAAVTTAACFWAEDGGARSGNFGGTRSADAPETPAAVAFGTDAGLFAEAGIPCVVFGPGSIEQAHTAREFVATDQVETATAIFRHLLEAAPR